MKVILQKSNIISGLIETVGYNCGCKKVGERNGQSHSRTAAKEYAGCEKQRLEDCTYFKERTLESRSEIQEKC